MKNENDVGNSAECLVEPFAKMAREIPDHWPGECSPILCKIPGGSIVCTGFYPVDDKSHGFTIAQWRGFLLAINAEASGRRAKVAFDAPDGCLEVES